MSLTLGQKKTLLQEYLAAERAVLKNQSYTIKDRTYTRATLSTLVDERRRLERDVAQMTRGGMRVRRFVFRDN